MGADQTIKGRRAYIKGKRAEDLVRDHYQELGFSILASRFKTSDGEIDLVVALTDLIVFVEVKRRASMREGLSAIPVRAQRRICLAASLWLFENRARIGDDFSCRFDVAIVLPDDEIRIVESAFQAGT